MRVQLRNDRVGDGKTGAWVQYVGGQAVHSLRAVLPNEIVFDLGDNTEWPRTRLETTCLWRSLHGQGIPFWGGPSGGLGTHTHIFGAVGAPSGLQSTFDVPGEPPGHSGDEPGTEDLPSWYQPTGSLSPQARAMRQRAEAEAATGDYDWRNSVAGNIVADANRILRGVTGWAFDSIDADYRLVAPADGSRMAREFGSKKSLKHDWPKRCWFDGSGPLMPIPVDRDDFYRLCRSDAPSTSVPRSDLSRFDFGWPRAMFRARCPTSNECRIRQCGDCPVAGEVSWGGPLW